MIEPGDMVMLNTDRVIGRTGTPHITLWTNLITAVPAGSFYPGEVGLVIARVRGDCGLAGTDTDQLLLLCGDKLGWCSAYYFLSADERQDA